MDPDGIVVPVDKPVGPTSHDVVAMARKAWSVRRIGHTGTLDPFASGLLLLCVGRATRLAQYLTGLDKTYMATARLGISTDTDDLEGEPVATSEGWRHLSAELVVSALESFRGELDQVPPQYSAKKVAGEAMHRRARRGETVTLPANRIRVMEMEMLTIDLPFVRFRVRCSSGTYIRALARDLGEKLDVGAHLTELRRIGVGDFAVDAAVALDEIGVPDRVAAVAFDPVRAVKHMYPWVPPPEVAARLRHGQRVPYPEAAPNGPVTVVFEGRLLAVGEVVDGSFRPTKVFG